MSLLPIYPDNILTGPYHVSLTLPSIKSSITESIGITSSTALLLPNVEYLTKFIDGDIGIGDSIITSMLTENYNSPISSKNEGVFKGFSKINKINLEDISKYKKGDKIVMPKSEIKVSPEFDNIGLKSIEKTALKSIFETQKPYMEIAKLIVENLAKIEDIIARVMPLLSISPPSAKSERPSVNSGTSKRPKALGYQNGKEFKSKVSKLDSISKRGGSISVDKNGNPIKVGNNKGNNIEPDGINNSETIDGKWEIISTVYSTGVFDPNVDYIFKFIDLKSDEQDFPDSEEINLEIEDPFQRHKPKTIILGIFDSDGNPLNPREKLRYLDLNDRQANSPFNRADWLLRSPKWIYQDRNQTDSHLGNPFYIWERPGSTSPDRESINNPDPSATVKGSGDSRTTGNNPSWKIKKYKKGQKNRLNGRDAVEGAPIITKFQPTETKQYLDYFKEISDFRINGSDLEEKDKPVVVKQVLEQVNIPAFLESVFLYSEIRSSVYKNIDNKSAFPPSIRKTFKPIRIKSKTAASDPLVSKFLKSKGQKADEIWIDPEADYKMKIIRVDPTSKIRYRVAEGEPEVEAEIKAFIRNATTFKIADSRPFNIEINRVLGGSESLYARLTGVNEYILENWNYIDNDGVISNFGKINLPPTRNNNIEYKIEIWSDINTPYYNNISYLSWDLEPFVFAEIERNGNSWKYNEFSFSAPANEIALNILFSKITSNQIRALYDRFKLNNNSTETETNILSTPFRLTGSSKNSIKIKGDLRDYFKYSRDLVLNKDKVDSLIGGPFSGISLSPDKEEEILLIVESYSYSSSTDETIINFNRDLEDTITSKKSTDYLATSINSSNYVSENQKRRKSFDFWEIRRIIYNIPISVIFSKKVIRSVTGKVRLSPDNSLVYVNNNNVEKWIYMNSNTETIDYGNGDFNISSLPINGQRREISIDLSRIEDNSPIQLISDNQISTYSIRVDNKNGTGAIIDPSKVLNSQLSTPEKFSNGKYGHGTNEDPQEIDIIYRYMLTELDTESYYIIEGILNEDESDNNSNNNNTNSNNQVSDESRWYGIKHAIGAIKKFISILIDIFSKLVPNMQKLIKLFKNPSSFVTDIISDKLGENVSFLSKDSINVFKRGIDEQRNIESITDPIEKKKRIKSLKDLFKNSKLSNYVFVSDEGKIISLLDGASTIPFGIFGLNIPFGMNLKLADTKPIDLIFPKDLRFKNVKNLQSLLKPEISKEKDNIDIATDLPNVNSKKSNIDLSQPNLNTTRNQSKSDSAQIKFKDGSSILIPNNSLDQFILDNKTIYNFVYLDEQIVNELNEIDRLIDSGSQDDLNKASDKLTNLSKSKPNNPQIEERKNKLDLLRERLKSNEQPILKLLLGLVTLPVKIIGGILEWLIDFFKSLSNPLTLPTKIAELLSFKWIMNFFTPKGLLEMAGVKFNPDKIPEWAALVNAKGTAPKIPKSLKLPADISLKGFNPKTIKTDGYLLGEDKIDLSEFLNVAFLSQLPKISGFQHRQGPKLPTNILTGLFCFIEKLINGIIDFVWSTLGIEAIIKPPHIKLCSKGDKLDKSKSNNNSKDSGKRISNSENNSKLLGNTNADLSDFIYEVKLPDGKILEFLNRDELDIFLENNKNINYDFNF
jgi:hypothetical protein